MMKRIFTCLLSCLALLSLQAQEIDESFLFVDEDGEIIEHGSTIIRDVVEMGGDGREFINSGLYVFNMEGTPNDFLKVHYNIERIDNGSFQICFPITCNTQETVGAYETAAGQLMMDLQDLQSEWFPVADGICMVSVTLELLEKKGSFPNFSYEHKAYGPTVVLKFVKGNPGGMLGDVNGDGEINIADINALIDIILTGDSQDNADVNQDGEVNIADINAVIDLILK